MEYDGFRVYTSILQLIFDASGEHYFQILPKPSSTRRDIQLISRLVSVIICVDSIFFVHTPHISYMYDSFPISQINQANPCDHLCDLIYERKTLYRAMIAAYLHKTVIAAFINRRCVCVCGVDYNLWLKRGGYFCSKSTKRGGEAFVFLMVITMGYETTRCKYARKN